jgi:hypothetical protein
MDVDIKRLLMTTKFEDNHIITGKPMELEMYDKKITIKQINWYYNWDRFAKWIANFFIHYMNVVDNRKLPDSFEDIQTFKSNIRLTLKNKYFGKIAFFYLKRICSHVFMYDKQKDNIIKRKDIWRNIKFMKQNFDFDDWISVFLYVYIYNIMGVKKNLSNALLLMQKAQ